MGLFSKNKKGNKKEDNLEKNIDVNNELLDNTSDDSLKSTISPIIDDSYDVLSLFKETENKKENQSKETLEVKSNDTQIDVPTKSIKTVFDISDDFSNDNRQLIKEAPKKKSLSKNSLFSSSKSLNLNKKEIKEKMEQPKKEIEEQKEQKVLANTFVSIDENYRPKEKPKELLEDVPKNNSNNLSELDALMEEVKLEVENNKENNKNELDDLFSEVVSEVEQCLDENNINTQEITNDEVTNLEVPENNEDVNEIEFVQENNFEEDNSNEICLNDDININDKDNKSEDSLDSILNNFESKEPDIKEEKTDNEKKLEEELKELREKALKDKEKLLYEINHDAMTTLKNKKAFLEDINAIDLSKLIVVSVDANDLKRTNDTLGHRSGDKLIIGIANTLKEVFPHNCYRTGGDEFMILPDYNSYSLIMDLKLEEIRTKLLELSKNDDVKYSVSLGYSFGKDKNTFQEVIDSADEEMYKNKKEIKEKALKNLKNKDFVDDRLIPMYIEDENNSKSNEEIIQDDKKETETNMEFSYEELPEGTITEVVKNLEDKNFENEILEAMKNKVEDDSLDDLLNSEESSFNETLDNFEPKNYLKEKRKNLLKTKSLKSSISKEKLKETIENIVDEDTKESIDIKKQFVSIDEDVNKDLFKDTEVSYDDLNASFNPYLNKTEEELELYRQRNKESLEEKSLANEEVNTNVIDETLDNSKQIEKALKEKEEFKEKQKLQTKSKEVNNEPEIVKTTDEFLDYNDDLKKTKHSKKILAEFNIIENEINSLDCDIFEDYANFVIQYRTLRFEYLNKKQAQAIKKELARKLKEQQEADRLAAEKRALIEDNYNRTLINNYYETSGRKTSLLGNVSKNSRDRLLRMRANKVSDYEDDSPFSGKIRDKDILLSELNDRLPSKALYDEYIVEDFDYSDIEEENISPNKNTFANKNIRPPRGSF